MRGLRLLTFVLLCAAALPATATAQSAGAILPALGSAPETGLQYGLAYLRAWQPDDTLGTRPSSRMGNAIYTAERQFRSFFESDRWTPGNERRRQWGVIAMAYPLPFYGPNVRDEYEESATVDNDAVELWFTRSRKLRPDTWGNFGARAIVNWSPSGFGSPDLGCDVIPAPPECALYDAAPARGFAHTTLMLTAGRAHDTRDLLFAPTRGAFTEFSVAGAYEFDQSEPFLRVRLDARRYRRAGTAVFAMQGLVQGTEGVVPVDQIVVMGSSTMLRGYEQGRHRDKWLAGAQAEWRQPTALFRERLGIVAFAGGAVMGSRVGELPRGRFFPSVGGGLRIRLDARTRSAVRVDYGVGSRGNSGLYVAFNETF